MYIRQGFWWAAWLALLGLWGFVVYGLWLTGAVVWVVVVATAFATASHWLNRPRAGDTELQELTMEAKEARLRSEIVSHQKEL